MISNAQAIRIGHGFDVHRIEAGNGVPSRPPWVIAPGTVE